MRTAPVTCILDCLLLIYSTQLILRWPLTEKTGHFGWHLSLPFVPTSEFYVSSYMQIFCDKPDKAGVTLRQTWQWQWQWRHISIGHTLRFVPIPVSLMWCERGCGNCYLVTSLERMDHTFQSRMPWPHPYRSWLWPVCCTDTCSWPDWNQGEEWERRDGGEWERQGGRGR